MNMQTLRIPSRNLADPSIAKGRKADPWTLGVLAIMSLLTISTPSVELFGVPRITIISLPFTLYMLFRIQGRLNSDLVCFVFAYLAAFIPATIFAAFVGEVRLNSSLQGALGLATLVIVGTYFYHWIADTNSKKILTQFRALTIFFIIFNLVELIFYGSFVDIRLNLYGSGGNSDNISFVVSRELAFYGGRPSALFSEPSHFARYIGLMMVAYVAATRRSPASLWASAAFVLTTRSVSFFFAAPAMITELLLALKGETRGRSRAKKTRFSLRFFGVFFAILLALLGIYYTQGKRIDAALAGHAYTSATISGDTSLNERILIPGSYFLHGSKSLLIGLGPTPQDEVQRYTLYTTEYTYRYRKNSDYKSAISTTILTVAGMGYLGIAVFCVVMFQSRGLYGVGLVGAYLAANMLSSGYHSTTSMVPSGLLLGLMAYQRRERRAIQSAVQHRPRVDGKRYPTISPHDLIDQEGRERNPS